MTNRICNQTALRWLATCVLALTLVAGCNLLKPKSDEEESDDRPSPRDETSSTDKVAVDQKTFTGTWKTGWGPVTLVQTGTRVTGAYNGQFTGSLEGEMDGDDLNITWIQTNGERGKARFRLKSDGNSFKGTWGSRSSRTNGGAWNGTRTK